MNMTNYHGPTEKHHIVFRSQGGADYDLNLIDLPLEIHKGNEGPHKCRLTDLILKQGMQQQLFKLLPNANYSLDQIIESIRPHNKKSRLKIEGQLHKTRNVAGIYQTEDIVRCLMGGRLY